MIKKTLLTLTLASLTSLTYAAIKLNVSGRIQGKELTADVILDENGHGELHFDNEAGDHIAVVADSQDDKHVLVKITHNDTVLNSVQLDVDNNAPVEEPSEGNFISVYGERVE